MPVLHIADLNYTPSPFIALGGVLVAVSTLTSEVAAGCLPIFVDVTRQASACALNDAAVLEEGNPDEAANFPAGLIRAVPHANEVLLCGVRPCTEEFIKRVIVPILVRRFIAQRNSGTLPARTGETL